MRPRPADLQERRRPVRGEDGLVAHLPAVDPRGPPHQGRHADAAFLQGALASGERPVVREALTAVVRGEEDEGVPLLTGRLQCPQHLADRPVQVLHQLRVLRHGTAVLVPQRALLARLDPPHDLGALLLVALGDPRPVRRREVEVEQPRPAVLAPDVLTGPLGQNARVVPQVLVRDVTFIQVVLPAEPQLRVVLQGTAEVPEELVPARLRGGVVRQVAAVPLADQRGRVPGVAQQRGERRVRRFETRGLVRDGFREAALRTPGKAPGVEAEAGGRAGRRTGVGVREPHTLAREAVQVRGLDVRRAVDGQIGPAEVVAEDEEDVGAPGTAVRGGAERLPPGARPRLRPRRREARRPRRWR